MSLVARVLTAKTRLTNEEATSTHGLWNGDDGFARELETSQRTATKDEPDNDQRPATSGDDA